MGFERFAPVERRIDINGRSLSVWRPPDMEALIDLVAFDEDERIPYWADVWESAIVLAEDLAAVDGKGLTLLELGCGLGLPSLAAARTGFTVTATDYESPATAWRRSPLANSIGGSSPRIWAATTAWWRPTCSMNRTIPRRSPT
jgi:hypothetical protein